MRRPGRATLKENPFSVEENGFLAHKEAAGEGATEAQVRALAHACIAARRRIPVFVAI